MLAANQRHSWSKSVLISGPSATHASAAHCSGHSRLAHANSELAISLNKFSIFLLARSSRRRCIGPGPEIKWTIPTRSTVTPNIRRAKLDRGDLPAWQRTVGTSHKLATTSSGGTREAHVFCCYPRIDPIDKGYLVFIPARWTASLRLA